MAATYEPIATSTTNSSVASVTFNSIPQTYTDLVIVAFAANSSSDASTTGYMQFNGDTASNYTDLLLYTETNNVITTFALNNRSSAGLWTIMGNTNTSRRGLIQMHILNYTSTNMFKSWLGRVSTATSASSRWVNTSTGTWRSTSAITSIVLGGGTNWQDGCTFTLYGIKAA
jgi:hypothetical protein